MAAALAVINRNRKIDLSKLDLLSGRCVGVPSGTETKDSRFPPGELSAQNLLVVVGVAWR